MTMISSASSTPAIVNGYLCLDCTQVDEARTGVNPEMSATGTSAPSDAIGGSQTASIVFAGALSGPNPRPGGGLQTPDRPPSGIVDILV